MKSIATGEGGAFTTNRRDVYEKLLELRTHGVVRLPALFKNQSLAFSKQGKERILNPWYYEMQSLGFNYRLTDLQAALGLSQLNKIESFMARRRKIAAFYDRVFKGSSFMEPVKPMPGTQSSYHLYVLTLKLSRLTCGRAEIFRKLQAAGLGVQVHYIQIGRAHV